jgi:hypothetical protein
MGVGLLGIVFFLNYKGSAIPLKELWFVLSFITVVAGAYLVAKYKFKNLSHQDSNINSIRFAEIEQLKRIGDKAKVTLDNAEVRTRNFQQEIIDTSLPGRVEMIDALYGSNQNYKTQEIRQTYIVFYKQYDGREYKFVSQATNHDLHTVKRYIDRQQGINLYIDSKNPTNYYFDLPYI